MVISREQKPPPHKQIFATSPMYVTRKLPLAKFVSILNLFEIYAGVVVDVESTYDRSVPRVGPLFKKTPVVNLKVSASAGDFARNR